MPVESFKPRLLIVGAGGFVGQHLARKAAAAFEVFEADLVPPSSPRALAIDTTSAGSVDAAFEQVCPQAVVLLAAVSDIDQCEARPEIAESVNVAGTANVTEACARTGAKLLFISSAAVFDGAQHGYSECDGVSPISVYGRTKVSAEKLITTMLPGAVILRLALVIGFAEGSGTNAMLNKFAAKIRAGETVSLPDFEFRNPIDAGTLSGFILELLGSKSASGIYHLGAQTAISRFELGVRMAARMGLSTDLIRRQIEAIPGRAARGADHFLMTEKIRAICVTPVPNVDEVIERAIHGSPQGDK